MSQLVDKNLAERIRRTPDPELTGEWPSERLASLREFGVFRWGLPVEFGGLPVTRSQLLEGYVELSRLCLTTAFILTQRDAACHRIAASPNLELRQNLLPEHCSGRAMTTVGISHLSTSRQHWSRPSVQAHRTPHGFELTGEAPWVTGARYANLLVTGASIENGEQILLAIPTTQPGITVREPLKLLALNSSCTGSVMLDRVAVRIEDVIVGPVPQVMKIGATGGTGSLTTTAVAVGATSRTLESLRGEAANRPDLVAVANRLSDQHAVLLADLLAAAEDAPDSSDLRLAAESLRHRANSLAARAAQTLVCCAKGAGFVSGHPAERSLREAMFFQVWSCPPSVTNATLSDLG